MSAENSLTQLQKSRNAGSAASWALAEPHRNHVTQLLRTKMGEADAKLCVLGAGNCTDLDLNSLLETFTRIELVDIDADALTRGVAAQQCEGNDQLGITGGCDITGVWDELARLVDASEKSPELIDEFIGKSETWPGLPELGKFGTVVSVCTLSQLVEGVVKALGDSHPRFLDAVTAIRQRHLRLLFELAAAGGRVVLITDFVSSDTAPGLPGLAGKQLADALMQMIRQHNFFTGVNPFRLQQLLTEDPLLAPQIHAIECELPWLWNFGPRHYAVTAISFLRV